MEANRLNEIRQSLAIADRLVEEWVVVSEYVSDVNDCLQHIDQQQAEIERLNRAYEVLEKRMRILAVTASSAVTQYHATESLKEAQRIKEGDGEQG